MVKSISLMQGVSGQVTKIALRVIVKWDEVEQGLGSHQYYRSHQRQGFNGSNDATNSVNALKEDRS